MLIRPVSDIHLEFTPGYVTDEVIAPLPDDNETVLVLAGDIHMGTLAYKFIEELAIRFKHILYTPGNHEYYKNDIDAIDEFWTNHDIGNLTFLQHTATILDDVLFVGGTLWTDFQLNGKGEEWFAKQNAKKNMNDFALIVKDGCKITPDDTIEIHKQHLAFIKQQLTMDVNVRKKVVVTHHLPHPICIDPKYAGNQLNAAFASNLDEMFTDEYGIDLWVHGHTHHFIDVQINNTGIYCNPLGYPRQERNVNGANPLNVIEV